MRRFVSERELFRCRPCPFLFLNTAKEEDLSFDNIKKCLEDLRECGFGGFILFNKPPTGFGREDYLSEKWFAAVENFAVAAKALSLQMWINDGYDYPPGDVAGRIKSLRPDLVQKHIALENGKLCVREADWGFPAFENPESGRLFVKLVYEEYAKRVGKYFGDPIVGFFSDADNRRVPPAAMFDERHPARDYFPWADDFEMTFRAVYGYDILPYMRDILKRKNIPQAAHYWEHAGRLYRSWFENNRSRLHEYGLLYTGHTSDSSPFLYRDAPRCSCFTEGRFSDLQSVFDYPGTDQELLALDGGKHMRAATWYSPNAVYGEPLREKMKDFYDVTHDTRAKQAASTAFLYGKTRVMCEMFAACNYGVSPAELKQIAAFQIMQGVTFVVPHAVHYRFFGATKYFAPPEFSARGMLGFSVKELNDEIAELCCMMEKGRSVCPVALLDPTEAVWRNGFDSEKYFRAFAALNRLPFGFAVCDAEKILKTENAYGFRAAVLAGFSLQKKKIAALQALGIEILSESELSRLSDLIPCNVRYEGEGTPHFARKNIDGEEFVFAANIENPEPVRGVLSAYGRKKDILLYPGDVFWLSASCDNIVSHKNGAYIGDLPKETDVRFFSSNLLPLERFENERGNAVLKTEGETDLFFRFFADKAPDGVCLHLPESCSDKISSVLFDGIAPPFSKEKIFDEDYLSFSLPPMAAGEHLLHIRKNASLEFYERIFLSGEFDANVETDKTEYKQAFSTYNLNLFVPKQARFFLSARRRRLRTDRSWALQGQPFYSGVAEYSFSFDFPADGNYSLVLPKVRDVLRLSVNGKPIGKRIKPPYRFEFSVGKGRAEIRLEAANSLANAMECYLEESGILSGGYFEKNDLQP